MKLHVLLITSMEINNELIRACTAEDLTRVRELIRQGADISTENYLPFRYCAFIGNLKMVQCLFNCGSDIHADNDSALYWSAKKKRVDVVKFLLQSGAVVPFTDDQIADLHPEIRSILHNFIFMDCSN